MSKPDLKKLAEGMKGWDRMTECWPCDENGPDWQVGCLDEDDNRWPLMTVDTEQYDQEQDAPKIAQYYAAANPSAVLELYARIERLERDAEMAAKKLRSAEICHPRAVDTLISEAREILSDYLPVGWPEQHGAK